MSVKIIVDSSVDMIKRVEEKVSVVPLTVCFGDEEFVDKVDINHKMFHEKLIESDVIPTTSQASPAGFIPHFEKAKEDGDSVVVITLSQKLSGTYQSACIAAEDYDNVYIVDSDSTAIGAGILVEYALSLLESGMSAQQIAEKLEEVKEKIIIIALLDTLEYLKKGGRISSVVAFAGGVLNIKPVACIDKGEIKILGKARGSKQGNNLLVQEIEKAGGVDFSKPVLLGYTGLSDALLQKYIEDSKKLWAHAKSKLNISVVGPIIGTHAGPGAVAVAFFRNN